MGVQNACCSAYYSAQNRLASVTSNDAAADSQLRDFVDYILRQPEKRHSVHNGLKMLTRIMYVYIYDIDILYLL